MPPRRWLGGWFAFIVALGLIGLVTAIISEVATVLECTAHLKLSLNGLLLVAFGSSLSDTFASISAAKSSKFADSSIGNIPGTNTASVFLGMGIPWIIGFTWWKLKYDTNYVVPPGSIPFSLIIFVGCSLICFFILGVRRCCIGGELGGSCCSRIFSGVILILLWIFYVVFVAVEIYGIFEAPIKIGDYPEPVLPVLNK